MESVEFSPPVLIALAGQSLLLLAGLAVLVRIFLTKAGRSVWRQPSPLTPLHWTWFEFGVATFVVIAGAVAGQVVGSLVVDGLPLDDEQQLTVLGAGFQLGMLAGAAFARMAVAKTRTLDAADEDAPAPVPPPMPKATPWFAGPITLLAALPLLSAANLGWVALLEHFGFDTGKQPMVDIFADTQSPFVLIGMSFLAVVIAPVTEEVIFRAGLFRFLRGRLPRPVALLLPAIIFGTLHGNLVAFLPLVMLGVFFALAYERTGRISVPIIAHGLFNLNTILMLLAGVEF